VGAHDDCGEVAFGDLDEGIGRRTLLQAAAAISAGAIAPAWTLAPGAARAARGSGAGSGPGPSVLQSGRGPRAGSYITSTPETIRWGSLPNRDAKALRTVRSGATVTFDTVSHEGILEDQGRDPVRYFASKGVAERDVLLDARAIAASGLAHDFDKDGPHIVSGPVDVIGARPGDVLRMDVVSLIPRAPYGVISNRHSKGALPRASTRCGRPPRRVRAPRIRSSTTTFRSSHRFARSGGRTPRSCPPAASARSSRSTRSWA